MNYKTFKTRLSAITIDDVKIVREDNDENLKSFVAIGIEEVASWTEPLTLLTTDISHDIYMHLEDGLLMRKPKEIIDDESIIDIDEALVLAVAYNVAKRLGSKSKKEDYKKEESKIITRYNTNRKELLDSGVIDLSKTAMQNSLNFFGEKKIYTNVHNTTAGKVYIWDEEFISLLDRHMTGEKLNLSKSDRKNLDMYMSFATGEMNSDDENYKLCEEFDKYLGSIR